MHAFRRGDLVFDVRDSGPRDGEPVVLLHGFPQDSTAYDGLAPLLHGAGLRTLAPDQRGYSPRARPADRSAYKLRTVTEDVLALLDAAGLTHAHVVGHDWGAFVGWALAAWHPDRMRSLTVLSVPHPGAYARALRSSPQALRSAYMGWFLVPVLPERTLLAVRGAPLRQLLKRSGLPANHVCHYTRRMLEDGALPAALAWYRAMPWNVLDPVGPVSVATLHVWSTGDATLDRRGTQATADFVRAPYRLEVLEGVSHWLPETAADRLAPLIVEHVRAAARSG